MNPLILDDARNRAEQLLLANGSDIGLVGSNQAYRQVWARDSMLCGLGLMECKNREGALIYRRSLETLRKYQSKLGKIPHNVGKGNEFDPALIANGGRMANPHDEDIFQDTAHSGCVDGNLFYILGQYHYYVKTHDDAFLRQSWESIEKALLWLQYQDSNECGLLEVHEAMDWADLFSNHYNILFDNILYCAVYRAMAFMAESMGFSSLHYSDAAMDVKKKINILFWVGSEEPKNFEWINNNRKEWLYPLKRIETELVERPFYLPFVAFRDFSDRFDTLGNLFSIVYGIADKKKANKILDYIEECGINKPFPVQATYPPIQPGDKDWRDYFRVRNLNLPHQYHNGGAWPFIGGIYVMALIKAERLKEARLQFESLTTMNHMGRLHEWEFNEWFHGVSGKPMGYAGQSWSCAMYIAAFESLKKGVIPVWGEDPQWQLE